jgi:hypothetical protein
MAQNHPQIRPEISPIYLPPDARVVQHRPDHHNHPENDHANSGPLYAHQVPAEAFVLRYLLGLDQEHAEAVGGDPQRDQGNRSADISKISAFVGEMLGSVLLRRRVFTFAQGLRKSCLVCPLFAPSTLWFQAAYLPGSKVRPTRIFPDISSGRWECRRMAVCCPIDSQERGLRPAPSTTGAKLPGLCLEPTTDK